VKKNLTSEISDFKVAMSKINLESITDQVRHLVQREIEAGRLTPGTRIREDEFARELGISKSPIRVALHQLKQDGIVRIEARKGFYVAMPTAEQVIELTEMREVLEGLAARRAAERTDRRFVKELAACSAGFRERDLQKRRMEYSRADLRFQRLLAQSSGSAELIRTLEIVNLRLHMSRLYAGLMANHDLVPVHQQHLEIIAAIKAGDADRAEAVACAHVAVVRRLVVLRANQLHTDPSEDDLFPEGGLDAET
jgi:DNA-binding GntR family transcriptional regulator